MKRFNLLYYLFILASMLLSVIMVPAMFIQQNALAGWLWILVFIVLLFLLWLEAIAKIDQFSIYIRKFWNEYFSDDDRFFPYGFQNRKDAVDDIEKR